MEIEINRNLVKERYKNVKFFHKRANTRRRNSMTKVRVNGVCLSKEANITEEVSKAF